MKTETTLILLLFLFGCQPERPERKVYPVSRIIDGDTIVISDSKRPITIRLLGIDCPERNEKGFDEARKFLIELLDSKSVYLEFDTIQPKYDRYGRTLAFVYRSSDNLFINAEIIRAGMGMVFEEYPCKYTTELLELQNIYQAGL